MTSMDLLLEAERRGILPENKKVLLNEARRRGLVGGDQKAPDVVGGDVGAGVDRGLRRAVNTFSMGLANEPMNRISAATDAAIGSGRDLLAGRSPEFTKRYGEALEGNRRLTAQALKGDSSVADIAADTAGMTAQAVATAPLTMARTVNQMAQPAMTTARELYGQMFNPNAQASIARTIESAAIPANQMTRAQVAQESGKMGAGFGAAGGYGQGDGGVEDVLTGAAGGYAIGRALPAAFNAVDDYVVSPIRNAVNSSRAARAEQANAIARDFEEANVAIPGGFALSENPTVQRTAEGLEGTVFGSSIRNNVARSMDDVERRVAEEMAKAGGTRSPAEAGRETQDFLRRQLSERSIPADEVQVMRPEQLQDISGVAPGPQWDPPAPRVDPVPPRPVRPVTPDQVVDETLQRVPPAKPRPVEPVQPQPRPAAPDDVRAPSERQRAQRAEMEARQRIDEFERTDQAWTAREAEIADELSQVGLVVSNREMRDGRTVRGVEFPDGEVVGIRRDPYGTFGRDPIDERQALVASRASSWFAKDGERQAQRARMTSEVDSARREYDAARDVLDQTVNRRLPVINEVRREVARETANAETARLQAAERDRARLRTQERRDLVKSILTKRRGPDGRIVADESEVGAIVDQWRYVREMEAKPPQGLATWIRSTGGLQDQGGEVSYLVGSKRNPMIRRNGATLDDAALRAYDQGFFDERPTIREFLDALHDDMSGNVRVRRQDENLLDDWRAAQEMRTDLDRLGVAGMRSEDEIRAAFRSDAERLAATRTADEELASRAEARSATENLQRDRDATWNAEVEERRSRASEPFVAGRSRETYPTEFDAAYEQVGRNLPPVQSNPLGRQNEAAPRLVRFLDDVAQEARSNGQLPGYKAGQVFDETGAVRPDLMEHLRPRLGDDVSQFLTYLSDRRSTNQFAPGIEGLYRMRTRLGRSIADARRGTGATDAAARTADDALLSRLYDVLTDEIETITRGAGPRGELASQQRQQVDAAYREFSQQLRRPLATIFGDNVTPEQAIERLVASTRDTRGNVNLLQAFYRVVEDKGDRLLVTNTILHRMAEGGMQGFMQTYRAISPEAREIMFQGAARDYGRNLDRLVRVGGRLERYARTAREGAGLDLSRATRPGNMMFGLMAYINVPNAITGAIGAESMARLLASRRFAEWLRTAPQAIDQGSQLTWARHANRLRAVATSELGLNEAAAEKLVAAVAGSEPKATTQTGDGGGGR